MTYTTAKTGAQIDEILAKSYDELIELPAIINPSLDLNFGQQEYKSYVDHLGLTSWPLVGTGSKITFARSGTGGGTYFDAMGVMQQAGEDEPRIDYDPVTGECLGLLIEEQRANLLPRSNEFDHTDWDGTHTYDVTRTPGVADPWGGTDAYTITATDDRGRLGRIVSGTSGIDYAGSIWIRRRTGSGDIELTIGKNIDQIITVTSEWQRITLVQDTDSTTVRFYLTIRTSGDAVDIFGAQLEAGAFPTSYIPTTTEAVTRNADLCSITSTNFSEWYRQEVGTVVCEAVSDPPLIGTHYPFTMTSPTTVTNRLGFRLESNRLRLIHNTDGGATTYTPITSNEPIAGLNKMAVGIEENNLSITLNGGQVVTESSYQIGTFFRASFGSHQPAPSAAEKTMHIRKLQYYPQRLTNVQLQALTRS